MQLSKYYQLGVIAQLGERFAGSEEVRGSIPLDSTNILNYNGRDAVFLY